MATGRSKNATLTRELILTAARRRFAAESYDAVGMRDVAQDAGINVALVSRYFGSKEELFRKVLLERPSGDWFENAKSPSAIANWLGGLAFSDNRTDREDLDRLMIILRSASSAATARIVGDAFVADVFRPLANLLGGPDKSVRAGLALSLVIGATVLNGILSVEPIPQAERQEGRIRLVKLLELSLVGSN